MILIYNTLIFVATILFFPIVLYVIFTNKNLKSGIKERFTLFDKNFIKNIQKNKKIVWIHASSVGEVNVSSILAKNFKKEFSDYKILITVMTSSGFETATKSKDFDFVTFVPFDFIFFIYRFLKIIKPKVILIAETEFWPGIFHCAYKKNKPLIIFNCRISDKSINNYLKFKFFFKQILNKATYFLCQNSETVERLIKLGVKKEKIKYTKNIKFDVTFDKFNSDSIYSEFCLNHKKNQLIITAGSTHENEEEIIINTFEELNENIENLFLIIAPRHIERCNEIVNFLKNKKLNFNLLSEKNVNPDSKILILDKMGVLIKAYSISTICFIGGSLTLRGGHNPLEAIYFKKPVVSGKNIFNFKEIYNLLYKNEGVILVDNMLILKRELKKLIENQKYRDKIAENGYKVLLNNKGAIKESLHYIQKTLFSQKR